MPYVDVIENEDVAANSWHDFSPVSLFTFQPFVDVIENEDVAADLA